MEDFILGLLNVLLWFLTIGGIFCAVITCAIGVALEASWTWCAIFPLLLAAIGEFILFKLHE